MSQIAIDGPAGAGKSTAARLAAQKLGFMYVDTGAMYRTIALECIKKGIDTKDEDKVSSVCADSGIKIRYIQGSQHMFIGSEDVSVRIRAEEVGSAASDVAKYPEVRKKLVELQKKLADEYDVIMDGRDIGNCVLPEADLKIFLTASAGCRAKRRFDELKEKGKECDLDVIREDIEARDFQDSHREISPLKQAPDAVLLDTSAMDIETVVGSIIKLYEERKEKPDKI